MGYIYQNAALTIAAANEPGSWGRGLFRGRHPLMARPCLVRFQIGQQSREAVFCQHVASVPSILDKRLWIFQEQVLSRRTLEFGPNYAVWCCNAMDMAESIPFNIRDAGQEVPPCPVESSRNLREWIKKAIIHNATHETLLRIDLDIWYAAVARYTHRNFSVPEEQFQAFCSVATAVSNLSGGRNHAGLWADDFVYGLAWYKLNAEHPGKANNQRLRGVPSWSWASRPNGPIRYLPRVYFSKDQGEPLAKFVTTTFEWEQAVMTESKVERRFTSVNVEGKMLRILIRQSTANKGSSSSK